MAVRKERIRRRRTDDLPTGEHLVCPRCGTAIYTAEFCRVCGLDLRESYDLPTADAYAARIRDKQWQAREEQQAGAETARREREQAARREKEWQARQQQAEATRTPARDRSAPTAAETSSSSRRSIPWESVIGIPLFLLGTAAAIWTWTGWDAPVIGESPFRNQVQTERSGSAGQDAAVQTVEERGFRVIDTDTYTDDEALRVLIGQQQGAETGAYQAFFFAGSDYLGTDLATTSGGISFEGQQGKTVSLRYQLWNPDDPACCPSGGSVVVRFEWNGVELRPLDPIPDETQRRAGSVSPS